MQPQPVFHAEYVEKRSRLTTFFRGILAIPHWIVLAFYGLAAALSVIAAWFALVVTGRYPQVLYEFVAGYQRYSTAVYAYTALLTDEYPPFSGDTDRYPVHLHVPAAKAEYSRLKAGFRFILAIPICVVIYAMQIVWEIGAFIAWFAIVILGRQPRGLQEMIELGLSYQQRAYAYLALLTEDWPPFGNPETSALDAQGPPPSLPPSEPAPTPAGSFAPPESPQQPERPAP